MTRETSICKYRLDLQHGRGGYDIVFRVIVSARKVERTDKVLYPALPAESEFLEHAPSPR